MAKPPPRSLEAVFAGLGHAYADVLLLISLTSDELTHAGLEPEYLIYDRGDILTPTTAALQSAYTGLVEAIADAVTEHDALVLQEIIAPGSVDPCMLASTSLYVGLGRLLAAEHFGEWVTASGTLTGPDMIQMADAAISHFDEAMAYSGSGGCTVPATAVGTSHADERLIHALRARAEMLRGNRTAALTGAVQAPGNWVFAFDLSASGGGAVHQAITNGSTAFEPDYVAVDGGGQIGLLDPIDGIARDLVRTLVSALGSPDPPPLVITSGREMRLIRAQVELAAGDMPAAMTEVNALRTAEGLTPWVPADRAEAAEAIWHERREGLFLQGRRLRDIYAGAPPAPTEWVPGSDAVSTSGALLPIPTPVACVGCPDQVAASDRTPGNVGLAIVDGATEVASVVQCTEDLWALESSAVADFTVNFLSPGPCPSDVAVFAKQDRMAYLRGPTPWTDLAGDLITAASGAPYELPLLVWRRTTSTPAESVIQSDLDDADEIFSRNRVGISVTASIETNGSVPLSLTCDARNQLRDLNLFRPGVLNVYYVDTVFEGAVKPLGIFCPDPTPGADVTSDTTYVLINRQTRWTTTLAHELSHAFLRLTSPHVQHPNHNLASGSFPTRNLMWSYVLGTPEVTKRDSLSIGQAFRMNVHSLSWLNRAREVDGSFMPTSTPLRSGDTRWCPCDWVSPQPCPPLALHYDGGLTNTPPAAGYAEPECFDALLLDEGAGTPVAADATALLDGWVAPGVCANDLLAQSRPAGTFHRLWFDDILDPAGATGSCDAELFVFARNFQLLVTDYDAMDFSPDLGPGTNSQFDVTWLMSTPHALSVRLWTHPGAWLCGSMDDTTVRTTTSALFTDNRSGLTFDFTCSNALSTGPTGLVCSPSEAAAGRVDVFWVPTMPGGVPDAEARGGVCPGGGVVYIVAPGSSETELAHQLGHAFALEDFVVDQPGLLDSDRVANLMMRGTLTTEGARTRFTLGQVARMYFHMSSFVFNDLGLTVGTDDRCTGGASLRCPELWVDVAR